jgi:hypothetical protein
MPDVNNEVESDRRLTQNPLDEIKQNILAFKTAIETTEYREAERLLQQQRKLVTELSNSPAAAIECIAGIQALLQWSMGALADQRKQYKDLLAAVLSQKQLDNSYHPAADRSPEFFSYSG